jgi:uncharacterized protein (TIGR03067 family)
MFRFAIRDMLWLTAVVGLALVWRVQNQARQRSLDVLNRNEAVADGAALTGRWKVMKTTSNGKTEDFDGKPAVQMAFFGDGWWREIGPNDGPFTDGECMIVRPGEINIDTTGVPGFTAPTKWRYKLHGGKLWMIRSKKPGDRPIDFDATNDPSLTLYELKKVELEQEPPAQQPKPVRENPPKLSPPSEHEHGKTPVIGVDT